MEKYLSVITNFGCHYNCPYCIVKKNNIEVPITTAAGLANLRNSIIENGCNIVSISGGGDPLFEYHKHEDWYREIFSILNDINIPIEIHTSYINCVDFSIEKCKRVVYHLNNITELSKIKRRGNEIVRVVFVVTKSFTESDLAYISKFVRDSSEIDELSFRQLVDENYQTRYYLHDILLEGHKKRWYYIIQRDFNLYYAENEVYEHYSDFKAD